MASVLLYTGNRKLASYCLEEETGKAQMVTDHTKCPSGKNRRVGNKSSGVWGHALGYGGRKILWSNVSDTGTSTSRNGREPAMVPELQGKEGGGWQGWLTQVPVP